MTNEFNRRDLLKVMGGLGVVFPFYETTRIKMPSKKAQDKSVPMPKIIPLGFPTIDAALDGGLRTGTVVSFRQNKNVFNNVKSLANKLQKENPNDIEIIDAISIQTLTYKKYCKVIRNLGGTAYFENKLYIVISDSENTWNDTTYTYSVVLDFFQTSGGGDFYHSDLSLSKNRYGNCSKSSIILDNWGKTIFKEKLAVEIIDGNNDSHLIYVCANTIGECFDATINYHDYSFWVDKKHINKIHAGTSWGYNYSKPSFGWEKVNGEWNEINKEKIKAI